MKRKYLGSKFGDFLADQGIMEERIMEDCRAAAIKFKIAHELEKIRERPQNQQSADGHPTENESNRRSLTAGY
jgi:hypothetical protein